MAQESNEWLRKWSSPRSPNDGNKHLEEYLDDSGRYWASQPNTPRSKSRVSREPSFDSATPRSKKGISHEPSFDSAQNSHEKPNIMTKVHNKTRKWKQILPYIRKHLNGQAHGNEKRYAHGHEVDKAKVGTTSVRSGDAANMGERHSDYLGTPSNTFHANTTYPRTLYESEIAPKLYRQPSMMQQGSIMNSPPRFAPSQSRFNLSPPQLTRCKSYRPRPGVKSGIEEVEVHDMTRTKSDPVRLKPVRLDSNEYQPTSFSFPTSPEIQELDDIEQAISYNQKLDLTKYPSSFSPRFIGNTSSLSPQLVSNAHDSEPQASEVQLSNSSHSIMVRQNNSNEMPFTDYNIIVEEINEILDSPSSLSSKAAQRSNYFSENQSAQDNHSNLYRAVSFPGSTQLNGPNRIETSQNISANMLNNGKGLGTSTNNESPTHKVLSEVAHKIAHSQVATNPELELTTNNNHLNVSFAPTETETGPRVFVNEIQVPSDVPDHGKYEDHRSTITFDNSKVASQVGTGIVTHTGSIEEANRVAGSANMPVDTNLNNEAAFNLNSEILPQACTIAMRTDKMTEPTQIAVKPQSQQTNSTLLEISKPINLKPIATKLPANNAKGSSSNSTNQDDYKTVTEAVTEILTPAYHAMSEAASKIVDSARIGTKKVAENVLNDNSNSSTGLFDDGDYKTVTEAVGEMLTPVYSAVSQATKVAGTGYQKGISLRDYLKSKAVVGKTRNGDNSLVGNEEVPNSPVPLSRNAYTEENEEAVGNNGRRLQESTN